MNTNKIIRLRRALSIVVVVVVSLLSILVVGKVYKSLGNWPSVLKSSNVSKFLVEKNAPIMKIRNVSGNFAVNLLTSFVEFGLCSKFV